MKTLSIDIETYSSVDLAKCGVYKYTEATDFDILLFGYSTDGGPVQVVDLACGEKIPPEVIAALTNDDVTKWAFNAQFERICLSRWLRDHGGFDNAYYSIPEDTVGNYLDPASWKCTMIWSAYMGLPLSLEGVGAVLGLGKQKLTEGKELIKYFCQPCAPTKANGGRTRNLPENAPDKWTAFKRYNIRDVEVEMSIQEKLAKFPVPEMVWEQYHLDQEINDRGVALDMSDSCGWTPRYRLRKQRYGTVRNGSCKTTLKPSAPLFPFSPQRAQSFKAPSTVSTAMSEP